MFRFMQELSTGSYFALSSFLYHVPHTCTTGWYAAITMTKSLTTSRHNTDQVIKDEHNRLITVVLAKHEIAPWWWFLRELKHVTAIVRILIVFNIPMIL
jgi:hypothetical protein